MRFSLGSDESNETTAAVLEHLRSLGHDVVVHGPPAGEAGEWAEVSETVAREVASGGAAQGVLFCWTGTGCSIAANKVAGVRAALCADAETARGARLWNDANVLAMSLRLTTPVLAREIVDAWLRTEEPSPAEAANIARVASIEGAR